MSGSAQVHVLKVVQNIFKARIHKNLEFHAAVHVPSVVPRDARCHPFEPFMFLLISSSKSDCSLYAKPQRFVDFVLILLMQLNKSRIESSLDAFVCTGSRLDFVC